MANPIPKDQYQAAVDEIHLEIGRAVTEWSTVEEFLFGLYAALLTGNDGSIKVGLSMSFTAVVSFQAKLKMIDQLVQNSGRISSDSEKEWLELWKKTCKRIQKASTQRNKLAHGSIISPAPAKDGLPVAPPVWVPYYEKQAYIFAKTGMTKSHTFNVKFEELTAKDIARIRDIFYECTLLISNLLDVRFPHLPRGSAHL